MSATFYRYDGTVRTVQGEAIAGASIAVLTQPADTSTLPGSPLATIYAAPNSNAPTVTAASWLAGTATLTLNTMPSDVVVGSYIGVSGITPTGYNGIVEVTAVSGLTVSYTLDTNPGTYVSGGTLRTSALPNPFPTDSLGNYFFYAVPGIYTVQIFDLPALPGEQLVLADQNVVAGGGTGSVTSVALALPAEFSVSGSPVSTAGTLTGAWVNQNANKVFAGPSSGGAAAPGFRSLVPADFPGAVGTVTSVALTVTVPSILNQSVTGSPVTTSGTLAIILTLANQSANTVLAGATSGGPSTPAFRALVAADIPALDTSKLTTGQLALARGGTHADLSATGGAGQYVKQAGVGANFTVGTIPESDVVNLVSDLALKAPLASPHFTGTVNIAGLQVFANNAAAITGGLVAGDLYRTGADPDPVCVVH
jgi:hypothetical protein